MEVRDDAQPICRLAMTPPRDLTVMGESVQVFGAGSAATNGIYHADTLMEYTRATSWKQINNPKT